MANIAVNMFSEQAGGYDVEFYTEGSGSKKQFMFEGIVAQADVINGNRRKYPSNVLMPAVEQYIEMRVNKGLGYGELDHPKTLTVSMSNVSHRFTELSIDGSNVIGKAIIADSPTGRIAKDMVNIGGVLGVSTRGGGKSKKTRGIEQMELFMLTAIDIVSFPSAPDALVDVTNEQIEFMVESGMLPKSMADKTIHMNDMTESEFERHMKELVKSIEFPTL